MEKESFISKTVSKAKSAYGYFWSGVWKDPRKNVWTSIVKTLNLTVRSFTDTGLQNKSMSLTYSTVLALVPALALLFAISRGFGFQDMVQNELYVYFPAQQKAISTATSFVDSYLQQSSQGLFVGIGIVMLLWTLISLLSNIEDVFNSIWGIKKARSLPQKVTDYIAICLMVPVLMICSSGASIFMSTIVQDNLNLPFLTPVINNLLELAPLVMAWLAFTLSYFLIPNIKVSFKYAAIAGAVCAIAFQILQLLFVNGQIYVTKYNAIYGSFAFLPLMLIWLQLSWLILLTGCVLTYSLQNVFAYNYMGDISDVSQSYRREVELVITALVFRRFRRGRTPYTLYDLSKHYDLPMKLVNHSVEALRKAGIIYIVSEDKERVGIAPAVEIGRLSVGELMRRLDAEGNSDFIPGFSEMYAPLLGRFRKTMSAAYTSAETLSICDLPLPDAINTK
ncbi:YihY/virulence factor BrkB family protein [Bacteroides acidifaciens]|uniref:YihY/virulence factor BrkB family protein n=1 Tax=Bacteroides acidifaciens TaxID=85831 RepID=UPI00259876E5|nr:YihY/virulence factor BrkB family protein [Bacteroides acidifaciens]